MPGQPGLLFHITTREAWRAAGAAGVYRPGSLEVEGFIHLSGPGQVIDVANRLYAGRGGLVLLVINPGALQARLVWEPPAGPEPEPAGEDFPHLYGPLNVDAVEAVVDFPPGPDGSFTLPEVVTALL